MNLFTGMTDRQIISALLMFALFNLFAMLEAAALAAFYIASKPSRGGRVRTASMWHLVAAFVFMWALVSTVWAAPAEKSFVENGTMFTGERFTKVIVGLVFMVIGLVSMLVGVIVAAAQKREAQRQSLVSG
jgi:formate hydrogenlyase subunit 3/multisubunit Na+/H+ antiporter MnhD subunit